MSIGTSTAFSLEWIVARMREQRPRSILDVGCGSGRWGVLAREFLEIWEHRYTSREWQVRITGIDVHPGTWTPLHAYIYNDTITADIRTYLLAAHHFDLIIACDVLEHMPKAAALALLTAFRRQARTLIGIPLGPGWLHPAGDDNPFSAHVSEWTEADFDGATTKLVRTEENGLLYGLFAFSKDT